MKRNILLPRIARTILSFMMAGVCYVCFPLSPAMAADSPAILVRDVDARDPGVEGRKALILIHGLGGSEDLDLSTVNGATDAEKELGANFIEYFYSNQMADDFLLYRYHYKSNEVGNPELAALLREEIDALTTAGDMPDTRIVLAAHSMGGLISRYYMQDETHAAGQWAGEKCGERVAVLVTLGTPHHGSLLANDAAREPATSGWESLYSFLDGVAWEGESDWSKPSRSDLLWDNYNNLPAFDAYPEEVNAQLAALNAAPAYLDKIIAYYGDVNHEDYPYKLLYDHLLGLSSTAFSGLLITSATLGYVPAASDPNPLIVYRGPYDYAVAMDEHVQQCFFGAMHTNVYPAASNDGLVSVDSASMAQLAPAKTRAFPGFDHMRLAKDTTDAPAVFDALRQDVAAMLSGDGADGWTGDDSDEGGGGGCVIAMEAGFSGWSLAVLALLALSRIMIGARGRRRNIGA